MANNRFRKKAKPRRKKASKSPTASAPKKKLTMDEMLARIPQGKDTLTTEEVQHIWNDCHIQTIYKMNAKDLIQPYRSRDSGKANLYKTDEIVAAIHARFEFLRPISGDNMTGVGDDQDEDKKKPDRKTRPARGGVGKKPKAKAKRRTR